VVTFPIVLSDLGLPASLLRYTSFYEAKGEGAKAKDLLKYSYWAVTILGFAFVALLWVLAEPLGALYQNAALPDAIRLLSLFLLLNNIFRVNYSLLQGMADIRQMQFALNLDNLLKLLLSGLFFLFIGPSFLTLAAGFLLAHCIAVLASLRAVVRKPLPAAGPGLSLGEFFREIVPFGLILSGVYSFYLVLSSSDRVLLGYLSDPAQATSIVAIYSIAITLATVLTIFPASVGAVFLPVMSRLAGRNDLAQMRSTVGSAQRWVFLITLPVAVFMILFSQELLGAFYGADYAAGWLAMSIFTLGVLVNSFSYLTASALAALRLVGLELRIVLVAAAANVACCLALIPPFGMEGAALASLISFTVMMALFRHYGWKLFGFTFPSGTPRMLLAAALSFAAVFLAKPLAFAAFGAVSSPAVELFSSAGLMESAEKLAYLAFLAVLAAVTSAAFLALAMLLKCLHGEDVALMRKSMHRLRMPQWLVAIAVKLASYGVGKPAL
jgi:O-antigen/teichoic acid export membrane protein